MRDDTKRTGPLAGMRVIELAHLIAGPSAAFTLQELGAEVVKIESDRGDRSRALNRKGIFSTYNRGKSSLVLDLKGEEGRKTALALITQADVLIEASQPGVMQRLGLDYDTVSRSNERIVYISASAFGRNGPDGNRVGLDAVIQAESGLMSITGQPDGPPTKVGCQVVDAATGVFICCAVLAALLHREKTGRGQYIETSLFDAALYLQSGTFNDYFTTGKEPGRQGNATEFGYPTDTFLCSDGKYLQLAAYFEDRWRNLCRVLDIEQLTVDPRFAVNADRLRNRAVLYPLLAECFRAESSDHWRPRLLAAGVPVGDVRTYDEIVERLQYTPANPFIADAANGSRFVRLPFQAPDLHIQNSTEPAPALGQHNEEILGRLSRLAR